MIARAALICHGNQSAGYRAEFTYWADVTEARQALADLTPAYGALCHTHTIVRVDLEPNPRLWLSSRTRT